MKTKRWCRKRAHHFTRSFQAHVPTNHQRYYRRRRPGRSSDCVTLARECVALGRSSEKRPRVACGAARQLVAIINARATESLSRAVCDPPHFHLLEVEE